MTAGESFVKTIKPIGCVMFLLLFAVFLVFCFSAKPPLEDYERPNTNEYYSEHIDELEQELETNLLPLLDGIEDCRTENGRVVVVIDSESFDSASAIIYRYYSKDLIDIQNSEK